MLVLPFRKPGLDWLDAPLAQLKLGASCSSTPELRSRLQRAAAELLATECRVVRSFDRDEWDETRELAEVLHRAEHAERLAKVARLTLILRDRERGGA